jgi:acetoin utilization deacetylase AcuC-like enzyme
MPITFISSPQCLLHDMDPYHPEQPARLHSINDQIISSGVEFAINFADTPPAELAQLYRAHDNQFVDKIIKEAPTEGHKWLDDDTLMMPKSLDAAMYAAGSGAHAVDLIMSGDSNKAFCAVRPPGHHAEYAKSGGFCIFNNIAVAALHALDQYGLKKVAIIDFDVHHGNGTEDIFQDDPRVLFCSSFQHPFYPFSGHKPTNEHILNIPIPAGTKGAEYREIVKPWFEKLDSFAPEMIFISAGFDGHAEDALGNLRLVEADYEWVTLQIKKIADKHCSGKIVSMLEGGYALSALSRSVVSHIKALMT